MIRKITVLSAILLHLVTAYAQIPNQTEQKTVDSLFAILPGKEGTARVDLLNQLALNLAPRSFDSGFKFATEAFHMAERLDYQFGEGIATFNIGNSYYFKAEIKTALTNYLTALRILEPFEPHVQIGHLYIQLGAVNQYVRNTDKMYHYYKRAAWNYQMKGDVWNHVYAYYVLSGSGLYKLQTLFRIGKPDAAEMRVIIDSSLAFCEAGINYILNHLDSLGLQKTELFDFYNIKAIYLSEKRDSAALDVYLKALAVVEPETIPSKESKMAKGLVYGNIGAYYQSYLGKYDLGYPYLLKSVDLLEGTDRYDLYGRALEYTGANETERGNYSQANKYFQESLRITDTFLLKIKQIAHGDPTFRIWGITQAMANRITALSSLVRLNKLTGHYKKALEYDSLMDIEVKAETLDELSRQIIGIESENEDERKRQEIALLTRDNELNRLKLNRDRILFSSIGGVFLIISLMILLWIQRKRFRSDKKAMLLEQKLLRSQMNPHFLFNSLTNIQNFILTEKPEKANIYLAKFAVLVRNILDNSVEEYIMLDKEISTIENYLELQKIRYSGKFEYRIHIEDEIDAEAIRIPPMLAQPFIENSIEHGIKHRETPGHIDIRFSLKDHLLVFEVEDDGIGRQKAREIVTQRDPEHKSMATSLTRERLANLNRKLQRKIVLEITDLKNALGEVAGTRVMFGIPVKE